MALQNMLKQEKNISKQQNKKLIITIDFGSNSNKYLISILKNDVLQILMKNSSIHKIAKNMDLQNYKNKTEEIFENLKKEIKYLVKTLKINSINGLAIGTEIYRKSKSNKINEIIEINKSFLKELDIPFEVISQEEESLLTERSIKMFFPEFIVIDMGGASTEITVNSKNIYKKFFYNFGCLSKINNFEIIQEFINFVNTSKIGSKIILIGGSFISFLLQTKKNSKISHFFYKKSVNEIEKFYKEIKDLNTETIREKYFFLKDREESIKTALSFIIYLLKQINKKTLIISTFTLLEGLAIKIVENQEIKINGIKNLQHNKNNILNKLYSKG